MSLKDQLIKAGIVSQKEADEKEQKFKEETAFEKQKRRDDQLLKNKQDNSAFFFYKRKETSCICPICSTSVGNNAMDVPHDIIKINSFSELNDVVKNKKLSYAIANKIVREHLDKVISFNIKFNNGKVKVSLCAECVSNNFMNTKYFVDPQKK